MTGCPGFVNPLYLSPVVPPILDCSPLGDVLPYIDGEPPQGEFEMPANHIITPEIMEIVFPRRKLFLSPVDPSLGLGFSAFPNAGSAPPGFGSLPANTGPARFDIAGPTSYVANATAFTGPPKLPASFLDGTSNTIAYAERYFACGTGCPGTSPRGRGVAHALLARSRRGGR